MGVGVFNDWFFSFWAKLVYWMEKALAPHSSTLARKIPWTEETGGLQSTGSQRVGPTERLHFHFSLSCIGEGSGSPLQCSCLENPRDGGAWWAAIYGVAQSWLQLKWLSSSSSSSSILKVASFWCGELSWGGSDTHHPFLTWGSLDQLKLP